MEIRNELFQVLTAAEAAQLWNLEESTVRRALWQGRLTGRKSGGTHLVSMAEMKAAYGPMPEEQACQFIESNLMIQDIEAWHTGEITENVQVLMNVVGLDCIQIWGSREGTEPLSVSLC